MLGFSYELYALPYIPTYSEKEIYFIEWQYIVAYKAMYLNSMVYIDYKQQASSHNRIILFIIDNINL